ncbi:hypothetical protein GIB67_023668 [Kingdonia uniflora]|uniref:Uncharacterized protein n=1 Tax=Kingdonia uniflora TaxID=39325 RepID=A0A7J7MG85_9MAGN|nr:hypothetical protein GIB67_023668 [Kingdonia uniflora]
MANLEKEKLDRGLGESISLEYYDGNVQGDLEEGFLCYLSQLENGLCLPLINLVKGIMNIIGACPIQLNGDMWEVINVCKVLNKLWKEDEVERRISLEDVLQFYGVKNYFASRGAYFFPSSTQPLFFYLNPAGPQSKVMKKESLLDIVAQEGIELEAVLKELKRGADGERQVVFPKASRVAFANVQESTASSKLAQAFPKRKMLNRGLTSGTTGSGEVEGAAEKRRADPPSQLTRAKATEDRLGEEDELKVVEDGAKLTVRNGEDEMIKMTACLLKIIGLGVVEEKIELKEGKAELKMKVARLKADLVREGKRLTP